MNTNSVSPRSLASTPQNDAPLSLTSGSVLAQQSEREQDLFEAPQTRQRDTQAGSTDVGCFPKFMQNLGEKLFGKSWH